MTGHDSGQRARDERLDAIKAQVQARVRRVCPDMPDELFFEMVERMAAIQLKYEIRETRARD